MLMGSFSQAADITLMNHKYMGNLLHDGVKLATGRIICQDTHSGFRVWINARQEGGGAGKYIVQSTEGPQHNLRIRIGGNGWSSFVEKGIQGVFNTIKEDASIFYIEVDGNQQVQPGKYLFSVSGECYI